MENVSGTLDLGGFLSEDLSEDVCAALCVRTRGRKLISKMAVTDIVSSLLFSPLLFSSISTILLNFSHVIILSLMTN